MKQNYSSGFSLIELMVAVAIVGILAAIAMPSYNNYVIRGSRAAAQTELLQLAAVQEKIYLNSIPNAYTANVATAYNGNSTTGGLGRASRQTSDGKYDLSLTVGAAPSQTYTLTAAPVAGKTQAGDGNITISENGQRCWYEQGGASCKSW